MRRLEEYIERSNRDVAKIIFVAIIIFVDIIIDKTATVKIILIWLSIMSYQYI